MDLTTAVRSRGYLILLVVAGLLGLPFGVVALLFVGAVHAGEVLVFESLPHALGLESAPWWLLLGAPALGGVLTGLAVHYLPGHGGHGPLEHGPAGEPVRVSAVPSIVLAALAGLCFGAVLGPEAPLIGLASGLGAWTASLLRRGDGPATQLLALTAVFAALAALVGGPLIAAIFLIESIALAGDALVVAILPALLASGTGWLAFTGFGDWTGITAPVLAVPELPDGGPLTWGSFLSAALLGVVAGLLCVVVRRLGAVVAAVGRGRHPALATGVAGLVIGAAAVGYAAVTGEPGEEVLFSGQTALPELAADGAGLAVGVLVVLALVKALAFAVALGGGFRGGPIFPALFLGGVLGTLAAQILPGTSPLAGFAAGVAAGTAGMLRLPLSALVLVTVVIGPANLDVLPVVIVALVVALVVATRLDRDAPPTIAPDRDAADDVGEAVSDRVSQASSP